MLLHFSKYQATGNDFIIIDNRKNVFKKKHLLLIKELCDRRFGIGADGLILLNRHRQFDFEMKYYNADGNISSMCGNGGRCITLFAKHLGIVKNRARFLAFDGEHAAEIKSYNSTSRSGAVSLRMTDVTGIEKGKDYLYLSTGSPHVVKYVKDVDTLDVARLGNELRYSSRFKKQGTNVNFVQIKKGFIKVRTYERGVEAETLSCGTGVTASVIATAEKGVLKSNSSNVKTPGGNLRVTFKKANGMYTNIHLIGPANFVFDGIISV